MEAIPQFLKPRFLILNAGIFFLACSLAPVAAQTSWNGAFDGVTWSNAGNWSSGVPSSGLTTFANGTLPDSAIAITTGSTAPLRDITFSTTGNRSVTLGGGTLNLVADATANAVANQITWKSGTATTSAVTINSDVNYSSSVAGAAATFGIINAFNRPLTFNGNITTSGSGARQMTITSNNVITFNGSNAASNMSLGGTGEFIAGSSTAFGLGAVQKTNTGTVSLRSDVMVNGTWSQVTGSPYTYLRISEVSASSTDRTFTFNDRIAGSSGAIEWIDNINSTGKLILELKYSGGTAQSLALITNETGIVRFAQSGNTTYSGTISGSGALQKTIGTGTTTLSAANSYSGKTTIAAGTLLLDAGGSIADSAEINLGTAGSQGTLNVTSKASFAFGTGQTVSGFGTINIGADKTVTVSGNLNPGNSPGQVNVTGDLAMESTTVTTMELAGDGGVKGTNFDNVTATGSLFYDGTLSIVSFGGFNLFQDGTYSLFDFASQSGNFDAVSFGGNALMYDAGIWSGSSGGYDFNLTLATGDLVVTVVPEPGTVGLLVLGGAMWIFGLRRRGRLSA